MEPWELFGMIKGIEHKKFNTSGDDVNWLVKVNKGTKTVSLIFEESCGSTDWKNNLNFPAKLYKNQQSCIRAARGWGNAYKSCNDIIMSSFIKAVTDNPSYKIEICGWSYGGAMAILAAEDFYFRTHIKPRVITFGAPKPIFGRKSKKYILSCVKEMQQYSNVNDLVVYMPPLPGYKRLSTNKVGGRFSLLKLFKPSVYHCIYDDKTIY